MKRVLRQGWGTIITSPNRGPRNHDGPFTGPTPTTRWTSEPVSVGSSPGTWGGLVPKGSHPAKHQPADSSLPRRTAPRTSSWTSSNLVHIGPDDFSDWSSTGLVPPARRTIWNPQPTCAETIARKPTGHIGFGGISIKGKAPGRGRSLRVCVPRGGKIDRIPTPVHGARFNVNGDCDLISRDSRQHCNLRL